jgi:hypothetical protein
MATDLHQDQNPSVTTLVSGIVEDAQELLKHQFELLKAEVKDDMRKVRDAGEIIGLGAGLGLLGGILLTLTLVYLLNWAVPSIPLWGCFGIIGALFIIGGLACYLSGKHMLDHVNPLPEKTAEALKENVQWITQPK